MICGGIFGFFQYKKFQILQYKIELRELAETFSSLSDEKKVKEQLELFTDDAEVTSILAGNESKIVWKTDIENAFNAYLSLFQTVYHLNGQHNSEIIDSQNAKAVNYCQVSLISLVDGKKMLTTHFIRYDDIYVKIDGKWKIKNRVSHFLDSETREMN